MINMRDFIHIRENIDSLIDEVRNLIEKDSIPEAHLKIGQAHELLNKMKQIALTEQLEIVKNREKTLANLIYKADNIKLIKEKEKRDAIKIKLRGEKLCIYAIKKVKDLNKAYKNGRMGTFTENKAWETGLCLVENAEEDKTYVPIVFANADSIWELLYWAKLKKVEVLPNTNKQHRSKRMTQYSFIDMKKYPKRNPANKVTDLVLNKTGKRIKKGFIKSYAICRKPEYLK